MIRALRCLLVSIAACGLGSCSLDRLAYDHLDFLARHYVSGFVDLRPTQQQAFDQAFDRLWRWHRSSELPRYASAVRRLAAVFQTAQTPQRIDQELSTLDQFGTPLSQHLLGELAPLLTLLDDRQVAQILKEVDRRIDKSAKRAAKLDDAHWRSHEFDQASDQIEKYVGPLQTAQQQQLRSWSQTLTRDPALTRRAAEAWRRRFAEVLQRRHESGHAERVQDLVATSDPAIAAFERRRATSRARYVALLAELSGTYTPPQRQHLQTSLNALAVDMDSLAAEVPASK
ncbi:MAG: hypothetical protein JWR16_1630 [Nevskia sp.]|nr:hypothetical protein [Nevskia sp.]